MNLCGVSRLQVIDIYRPLTSQLAPTSIPVYVRPCLYAGEFNGQQAD